MSVVVAAIVLAVIGGWFLSLKEIEKKRFIQIDLRKN